MVKKILAIDGGGMYGVVPLAVCLAIEERLQKPLRDIFDLFVGTSTGSLISAAALSGLHHEGGTTTFGLSAQEIFDAYEEYGRQIFSAKRSNSHYDNDYHYLTDLSSILPQLFRDRIEFSC